MSDPREVEAKGKAGSVEFRGLTLTFPIEYDDYPLSFIEAAAEGASGAIQARELLGPEQWSKVRALNLKGRDLNELVKVIDGVQGTDAGEDEASSA